MPDKILNLIKKYREQLAYLIVGGCTTVISFVSYLLASLLFNTQNPLELQVCNVLSWVCAVSFAFFTNRRFVFQSQGPLLPEAMKFAGARVLTLLIDMAFMALFVNLLLWNDKLAKLIVQFVVLVLNYVFSKLLVFRKK